MIQNPRRSELSPIAFLNNALDLILSQWHALFTVEHDEAGHHTDITADSITLTENVAAGTTGDLDMDGDLTVGGNLSVTGGDSTLGVFVFDDGGAQQTLTISGTTTGWRIARKAASSPLNGTYAFALYDMASPNFPVLEIGTIGGVYHLLPHDSSTLALGYGLTSTDRILAVYVQNGLYERGRTAAAGEWQVYTPTWTGTTTNPTLSDGTLTGRYTEIHDTVHFQVQLLIGSGTTLATGLWELTVPVTAAAHFSRMAVGTAFLENSGVANYIGVAWLTSTTQIMVSVEATGYLTEASPFVWGTGDFVTISGMYEQA